MQPIERYALVTLLFLVVLVMVVALWDDGSVDPDEPREDVVARLEDPAARQVEDGRRAVASPKGPQRALPLNDRNRPVADMKRVLTRPEAEGQHSVERGGARRADTFDATAFKTRKPRAQTPEELADLMTPEPRDRSGGTSASPFMGRPGSGGSNGKSPSSLNSNLDAREGTSKAAQRGGGTFAPRPKTDARKQPVAPVKNKSSRGGSKGATATKSHTYTVKSGDSLEQIARHEVPGTRLKAAMAEIARLNGLSKPYTIYAGDDLQIPASSSVVSSGASSGGSGSSAKAAVASGGRSVHTIRSGEVLSNVLYARYGTYGRSIGLVKELNPGLDPDRVVPGTKIVMPRNDEIPGGVKKVAKSTSSKPSRRAAASNSEFVVR